MKEKVTRKTCLSCGVCCMPPHYQDTYCDLTEKEVMRLGPKIRRLVMRPSLFNRCLSMIDGRPEVEAAIKTKTVMQRSGPFKGKELCMCALLKGTPLVSVRCSVYRNRPRTCHDAVNPGERACRDARKFWSDIAREQCGWAEDKGPVMLYRNTKKEPR